MDFSKFYRGYVETGGRDGKAAMQKYDKNNPDVNLLTLDQAKKCKGYAGVLKDGVVLVDIDNEEQAETALKIILDKGIKCPVFKTTRGLHFLFSCDKKITNNSHVLCTCGLIIDYKCGYTNSLQVLKRRGEERKLKQDGDLLPIPFFFYPTEKRDNDAPKIYGLREGDGRNDTLFSFIPTLLHAEPYSMDKELIRKLYREIINPYILGVPLDDRELESVLRDEAFDNIKPDDKTKWDINNLTEYILRNENVAVCEKRLCIYRNGLYDFDTDVIERIIRRIDPKANNNKRKEVLRNLKLDAPEKEYAPPRYIAFKNGIYDIETDELLDFSPDYVIPNIIPHDYNPNADQKPIDNIFYEISNCDESICKRLEEVLGVCMSRKVVERCLAIMYGGKKRGKSTILNIFRNTLGKENVTAADAIQITSRFGATAFVNKLAILGDDIDGLPQKNLSTLKKIASGETLPFEKKFGDISDFLPYATPIFSCNNLNKIDDKEGAVLDRIVMIPFDRDFSKDYKKSFHDCDFNESFWEGVILNGLEGLRRVEENGFTKCERADEIMNDYKLKLGDLLAFIDQYNPDGKTTEKVFEEYRAFCSKNDVDCKVNTVSDLTKRLKHYGYNSTPKKIKGKSVRIYKKTV